MLYTKEETAKYANLQANHTVLEIASNYNLDYRTLLHSLIYYKFREPKHFPSKIRYKDEEFFSKIDSPIKAYYLGFLFADGSIYRSLYSYCVSMGLQAQDKYILDTLNSLTCPSRKVSKYRNSYKWEIHSQKMYEDLHNIGIVERKSWKDYHYPDIPSEYDSHFIRGFFDGDGCITIKSTGYSVVSFGSNSKVFLDDLKQVLLKYGIEVRPLYAALGKSRTQPYYTMYLKGGENKSKFKQFLYKDAEIYLQRKYIKFMKIPS